MTQNKMAYLMAYKSYVIPLLEYCSQIWCPCSLGDIDRLEGVQRFFTRRLVSRLGFRYMDYQARLNYFRLEPLELRRLKHDLAMTYRIIHNDCCLSANDFFEYSQNNTRGHPYKISIDYVSSNIRKSYYAVRVRNAWNALPLSINNKPLLLARNVEIFKILLGKVDLNRFLHYNRH